MTERQIQNELWTRLRANGHEWMMPNYTPAGWWECDMFSTTRAGFMVEHEIKLSVSDFRADAEKCKTFWRGKPTKHKKHDLLGALHPKGPARFFYVVPWELVKEDDCPPFAGLIYVAETRYNLNFRTVRQAPKLHGEKCDPKVLSNIGRTCFWRYWTNRPVRDPGGRIIDYEI